MSNFCGQAWYVNNPKTINKRLYTMHLSPLAFYLNQCRSQCRRYFLPVLLLSALVSCRSVEQSPPSSPDQPAAEDLATDSIAKDKTKAPSQADDKASTKDRPKPIAAALKPGEYCYQSSDEIQDVQMRLTLDASDQVTGKVQGTVHNKADGYYTSYRSNLNGTIDGSNLNLDVATWIEYDQQNKQETWRVSPDTLSTPREKLTSVPCDAVNKAFQDENGLEAKDLTSGATSVNTQAVYFDSGKSSTTVSNSVVRGDADLYTLNAQGGQSMKLSITSGENNAVFNVVDPTGMIVGTELTNKDLILEHTGEYQIIVSGTRGNATYDLAIAIQ
jgi:hypothetical protein